jgi:hypothetical protein
MDRTAVTTVTAVEVGAKKVRRRVATVVEPVLVVSAA